MTRSLVQLDAHPVAGRCDGHVEGKGDELRIGDLARATEKTTRALRLYEELGLLTPGTRTAGGFRTYGPDAIERVRWIGKLQDLGFTLQQIQELIAATAQERIPRDAMGRVRSIFHEKLDEVAAQIARLSQLQRELATSLAYLETCGVCSAESQGAVVCVSCREHGDVPAPGLITGITGIAGNAHHQAPAPRDPLEG
jgi:DNA-binding transcriptional MerR regulator